MGAEAVRWASVARSPYGGIPFGDFPAGLGHDLGRPERPFTRAWAIRRLAPMSSLTLLP